MRKIPRISTAYFYSVLILIHELLICVFVTQGGIIISKIQKNRHLTLDERIVIEKMLDNGKSVSKIAEALDRPVKTIAAEIARHVIAETSHKNDCLLLLSDICKQTKACVSACGKKLCYKCRYKDCQDTCSDYTKAYCDRLSNSPHVCNGCNNTNCPYDKAFYKAIKADRMADATLHDKRSGFDLTDEELNVINDMVSPLILNGHSPYSACQILGDKLPVSESTLYRLIDSGLLDCRNIDLPEKVKRKPPKLKKRNNNKDAYAVITTAKAGHLWSNYLKYTATHDVQTVQMDCVIGKITDEVALLTLHWEVPHFQIALMIDTHTAKGVVDALDKLEVTLGLELFREMFPIILTDNGTEFTDIDGMQRSCTVDGEQRTYIYFCEPNRSDQKGEAERNHKELRKIFHKSTSLEPYTQEDVWLAVRHMNSYPRKSLGGKCPFDYAKDIFPEDFFTLLGLEQVESTKVIMKDTLIKKN